MADGRRREAWQRLAVLLCQLDNCRPFRSKDAPAAKVSDYDPYHRQAAAELPRPEAKPVDPKASFSALAQAFGFDVKAAGEPTARRQPAG